MAKNMPAFVLEIEDSEGKDYALTLAYCHEEREQPHKLYGFLLMHVTEGERDYYCVNACGEGWLIRESRGALDSVDHALLFAREHWQIPVRSWRIFEGPDFSSEAISRYEFRYRNSRRRAARLIWQFQEGEVLKRLKGGDARLRSLYEILKEEEG